MNIENQIDILKKQRSNAFEKHVKPLDDRIKNLEDLKEKLKDQVVIDYETEEKQAQINRILNFNNDE